MKQHRRVLGVVLATSLLMVLLVLPTQTSSTTNVNLTTHGVIRQDEIWRDEIHIIGDIEVARGVTLTIEPGTRVLIAANQDVDNLQIYEPLDLKQGICPDDSAAHYGIHRGEPFRDEDNHISLEISGTLHAVGTPDEMITITSDSPNPGRYDWNGFFFRQGTLSYAVVEYYRHLSSGEGTTISHSILRHIGECAVCLCGGQSLIIENNTMYDTGHELIDTHPPSAPMIRNNHLGPNPRLVNPGGIEFGGVGIILDRTSPEIVGNTIEGCNWGIAFIGGPPAIPFGSFSAQLCSDNDFASNGADFWVEESESELDCKTTTSGSTDSGESSQEDEDAPRERRD